MPSNIWDQRYSKEGYAYGTAPNDFLVSVAHRLPKGGQALCLGEGEGRNAVFLAERGYEVTAVDLSPVGLDKAERLAAEKNVKVKTVTADLAAYPIMESRWDLIVSIWCHLFPAVRQHVHAGIAAGLKKGGMAIMEAYTPDQLEFKTGGPPVRDVLVTAEMLREELRGLRFEILRECEREVHEGRLHNGLSAVVQVLAVRP